MVKWLRCWTSSIPALKAVHGSREFKSLAMLVNSQLICPQPVKPVGILNPIKFELDYLFYAFAQPQWH